MTLNVTEAGVYTVFLTSSADISIVLIDCGEPLEYYSRLDDAIEMAPGRKRLVIGADIADAAVGDVVLRLAPPTTPVTPGPRGGLHRHRHGHFRADSERARD